MKDSEECKSLWDAIGGDSLAALLTIEGEPRSKAQATQREHSAYLRQKFMVAVPQPILTNVAISCIFYRSSKGRIDVDNLLKQIFDSGNDIFWRDDMQVTACAALLRLDRKKPRTIICIGNSSATLDRSTMDRSDQDIISTCINCHKKFAWRQYPSSNRTGQFCSMGCMNRHGRSDLRAPANCRVCSKPFHRRYAAQFLCSEVCRKTSMITRNKKGARTSFCQCCGIRVSRIEYRRCRECFRAGRTEVREFIPP